MAPSVPYLAPPVVDNPTGQFMQFPMLAQYGQVHLPASVLEYQNFNNAQALARNQLETNFQATFGSSEAATQYENAGQGSSYVLQEPRTTQGMCSSGLPFSPVSVVQSLRYPSLREPQATRPSAFSRPEQSSEQSSVGFSAQNKSTPPYKISNALKRNTSLLLECGRKHLRLLIQQEISNPEAKGTKAKLKQNELLSLLRAILFYPKNACQSSNSFSSSHHSEENGTGQQLSCGQELQRMNPSNQNLLAPSNQAPAIEVNPTRQFRFQNQAGNGQYHLPDSQEQYCNFNNAQTIATNEMEVNSIQYNGYSAGTMQHQASVNQWTNQGQDWNIQPQGMGIPASSQLSTLESSLQNYIPPLLQEPVAGASQAYSNPGPGGNKNSTSFSDSPTGQFMQFQILAEHGQVHLPASVREYQNFNYAQALARNQLETNFQATFGSSEAATQYENAGQGSSYVLQEPRTTQGMCSSGLPFSPVSVVQSLRYPSLHEPQATRPSAFSRPEQSSEQSSAGFSAQNKSRPPYKHSGRQRTEIEFFLRNISQL
ncbi:Hypothetical predicted protein [Cloeon dipterum]|uniref:Uncharacterized protein n=1 Tax=Cloeon dipterum TaxID=197152 RepID=A0A8S1DCK7_9INSE|nr:Hypothetical predicted protein [Cloeon dipterum]